MRQALILTLALVCTTVFAADDSGTGTPVGDVTDASIYFPARAVANPHPNIWVGHYADYRHGTHVNETSCANTDGLPYYWVKGVCADTITEFVAYNGSNVNTKVRFQGLRFDGSIAYERDTIIPAGATRLLIPSKALQHGIDLGETFIITSYSEVLLFAKAFWTYSRSIQSSNLELEIAFALNGGGSGKRQIDLIRVECGPKDFRNTCETPVRQTPWNVFIPGD